MALEDDINQALRAAGEELKKNLWKPEDDAYLKSRTRDLIGLNQKAQAATNPAKKKAYQAAALDVVQSVKMLALIRAEVANAQLVDSLGKLFVEKVLPLLIKLLPLLLEAL